MDKTTLGNGPGTVIMEPYPDNVEELPTPGAVCHLSEWTSLKGGVEDYLALLEDTDEGFDESTATAQLGALVTALDRLGRLNGVDVATPPDEGDPSEELQAQIDGQEVLTRFMTALSARFNTLLTEYVEKCEVTFTRDAAGPLMILEATLLRFKREIDKAKSLLPPEGMAEPFRVYFYYAAILYAKQWPQKQTATVLQTPPQSTAVLQEHISSLLRFGNQCGALLTDPPTLEEGQQTEIAGIVEALKQRIVELREVVAIQLWSAVSETKAETSLNELHNLKQLLEQLKEGADDWENTPFCEQLKQVTYWWNLGMLPTISTTDWMLWREAPAALYAQWGGEGCAGPFQLEVAEALQQFDEQDALEPTNELFHELRALEKRLTAYVRNVQRVLKGTKAEHVIAQAEEELDNVKAAKETLDKRLAKDLKEFRPQETWQGDEGLLAQADAALACKDLEVIDEALATLEIFCDRMRRLHPANATPLHTLKEEGSAKQHELQLHREKTFRTQQWGEQGALRRRAENTWALTVGIDTAQARNLTQAVADEVDGIVRDLEAFVGLLEAHEEVTAAEEAKGEVAAMIDEVTNRRNNLATIRIILPLRVPQVGWRHPLRKLRLTTPTRILTIEDVWKKEGAFGHQVRDMILGNGTYLSQMGSEWLDVDLLRHGVSLREQTEEILPIVSALQTHLSTGIAIVNEPAPPYTPEVAASIASLQEQEKAISASVVTRWTHKDNGLRRKVKGEAIAAYTAALQESGQAKLAAQCGTIRTWLGHVTAFMEFLKANPHDGWQGTLDEVTDVHEWLTFAATHVAERYYSPKIWGKVVEEPMLPTWLRPTWSSHNEQSLILLWTDGELTKEVEAFGLDGAVPVDPKEVCRRLAQATDLYARLNDWTVQMTELGSSAAAMLAVADAADKIRDTVKPALVAALPNFGIHQV